MEVTDTSGAALHDAEPRWAQQLRDVAQRYMSVSVGAGKKAAARSCQRHEVDSEDPSLSVEHATYLARELARGPAVVGDAA